MAVFGEDKLVELEAFVTLVKADPNILHRPELKFFKDYLESLGAFIQEPVASEACEQEETFDVSSLNDEEVVAPENILPPQLAPAGEKDLTEGDYDNIATAKNAAINAVEDGNLSKAVELYTDALLIGNPTALLYTRRAEILLKLKRNVAAIGDCDEALKLNPDNARAYKIRGKANRYLGNWRQAHFDLDMGQKLDYDENLWDMQKLVDDKFKKIEDHERLQRRQKEEREENERERQAEERRANARRAYEEAKKRDAPGSADFCGADGGSCCGGMPGGFPGGMPGGFPGGMPGGFPGGMPGGFPGGMPGGFPGGMPGASPGGMSGLGGLLGSINDPDIQQVFSNPKMMTAFQDILSNPGNIGKYKDDPEILAAFGKLSSKFGGAMPGFGNQPKV